MSPGNSRQYITLWFGKKESWSIFTYPAKWLEQIKEKWNKRHWTSQHVQIVALIPKKSPKQTEMDRNGQKRTDTDRND